ncbi:hypothetical protein HYV83_02795 [Candidatus Woesearchaeota archaeon]|nr:hypothetical protein [Candidatus Woesearchaeota archaeon]
MGTKTDLEQKVRKITRPRTGKLLGRQWRRIGFFYEEVAIVDGEFTQLLNRHLSAQRGNLTAILNAGVKWGALKSYRSGKDTMPFHNYLTIFSCLNDTGQGLIEKKELPDKVTGAYVSILLAWYFDRVDNKTRELPSPMYTAVTILLSELARADVSIWQKLRGTEIDNRNARIAARDLLTGRKGFIPYGVLRSYEDKVIRSLGITGIAKPEELREAFRQADMQNLETSLETGLRDLYGKAMARPKPYSFKNGETPGYIDYFVGGRVTHPQFGQGVVLESEAGKPLKLTGMPPAQISYTIKVDFGPVGSKKLLVNHQA